MMFLIEITLKEEIFAGRNFRGFAVFPRFRHPSDKIPNKNTISSAKKVLSKYFSLIQ